MATYNYEPAYPLNTEAGSTEKPLSACQKIKAEFERIYRILNSSFATVDEMVAEARQSIANAISTFNQLAETLRSEMSTLSKELNSKSEELNSKINTKSKEASTVGTYTEVEANGTATQNGFLIVWHDNSGYQLCTLSINGTIVGKWTGDGSYGGAMVTGTFPIAKGQNWAWGGTYSAPASGKILFVPIGN